MKLYEYLNLRDEVNKRASELSCLAAAIATMQGMDRSDLETVIAGLVDLRHRQVQDLEVLRARVGSVPLSTELPEGDAS